MKKRKPLKKKRHTGLDDLNPVYLVEYEITYEPIQTPSYKRLPESAKKQIEKFHKEAPRNPRDILPELLKFKAKYPQVPQVYNYLAVAYMALGKQNESEAITQECLRKVPDYLFARLNLAEIYLAREEYEKIPELFHHKYDLKMVYPKRKRFHISEVANFMGIMGLYFARTDQRDVAERYNETLQQIAPGVPVAKALMRELHPGLVLRLLNRFIKKRMNP